MSKIKDAVKKIEQKRLELFNSITELDDLIVYAQFGNDLPKATISNDGDVFIEWRGNEMGRNDIEYCMSEVGYITPSDF